MNIRDFLIDPGGKDWPKLLSYWRPPLPEDASMWLVNMLGEIIFGTKDGAIHRLVVGTGAIERLAGDRQAFARQLDVRENADAWLRIGLVEGCRKDGMKLGPEECLGFRIPPQLLGEYSVGNLQPTNIYSHYSWLAHLSKQDEIYWTGD